MKPKSIGLTKELHKELSQLKIDLDITNFEDLIKYLINNQKN